MAKTINLNDSIQAWRDIRPISEKDRDRLSRKFTVEFNYNSNHIEGNTLTYGQTELLLLFGKVAGEARMFDLEEMKAGNVGLLMVKDLVARGETFLTQTFIRQLHKTLLREDYTVYRNLPDGTTTSFVIHAGQYKTRPNSVITRYGDRFEYASPEETPALMADLVDWYNEENAKGELSPSELAILFHYRYIRIHPFEDGNGRIARLMVNYILSSHGWPMIVIRSRQKDAYLEALHQADLIVGDSPSDGAHAELKDIAPFIRYMTGMMAEEINNDVLFLSEHNDNTWWYDGQKITFRTPSYTRILRMMQSIPAVTYAHLQEGTGINMSAVQKIVKSLQTKGFVERHDNNGDWQVLLVQ